MKDESYTKFVEGRIKDPDLITEEMDDTKANLLHMAIGVAGEAGELLDAIKKFAIYNKELDVDNVIEELGDLEFYMEGMRQQFNFSRAEILKLNFQKLSIRYPQGYSDKAAQLRADKNG